MAWPCWVVFPSLKGAEVQTDSKGLRNLGLEGEGGVGLLCLDVGL